MSEEKETITCPKCGTENKSSDKFCGVCGNILVTNEKEIKQIEVENISKNLKLTENPFVILFQSIAFFLILACSIGVYYAPRMWNATISELNNNSETMFQILDGKIDALAICLFGIAILLSATAIYTVALNSRILNKIEKHFKVMNDRFNNIEMNK